LTGTGNRSEYIYNL